MLFFNVNFVVEMIHLQARSSHDARDAGRGISNWDYPGWYLLAGVSLSPASVLSARRRLTRPVTDGVSGRSSTVSRRVCVNRQQRRVPPGNTGGSGNRDSKACAMRSVHGMNLPRCNVDRNSATSSNPCPRGFVITYRGRFKRCPVSVAYIPMDTPSNYYSTGAAVLTLTHAYSLFRTGSWRRM